MDEREEQAGTEENDTEKRVKANDSGDSGEGRQGEATGERMKRSANAEEEDRSQPAPDKRPKTAESGPSSNKPRSSRVSPRLKGLADKQNVSGKFLLSNGSFCLIGDYWPTDHFLSSKRQVQA